MHFVRIIYIFPALAKCLCCLLFPFGTKIWVIMHSNINIPMRLKSNITQFFAKKALREFGDIIRYFYVLSTKMFLFAITAYFLFQIKTSGFHLKEEGKELLGMLMAALANNNGYYVLYLFLLSFSNSKLLFLINWHQPKVLIAFRLI